MRSRQHQLFVAVLVFALPLSGCYHYRAAPFQPASETDVGGSRGCSTDPKSQWVVSWAWGLAQQAPTIDNCAGEDLQEVTFSTNLGTSLVTILTLGVVAPAKVTWCCAKPQPEPGVISAGIGDAGGGDAGPGGQGGPR